jgi:hypothetical protein
MFLTQERSITLHDKYQYHVYNGAFQHATIETALKNCMDAIHPETFFSQKRADSWDLFDATKRAHIAYRNENEEKLTYL